MAGFPLVSPLEVTIIWTAIIQQRIPCSKHKHVLDICALQHLNMGQWEQTGEKAREKSWDGATNAAQRLLQVSGKGKNQVATCMFYSQEQRDTVNVPVWRVSTSCGWTQWPAQRLSAKIWPQFPGGHHCQAESHEASLPPVTLTELTLPGSSRASRGPQKKSCSNVELHSTLSAALKTEEAEYFPSGRHIL